MNDHQNDRDRYDTALTFAYNNHVHRSTKTTPFEIVLSRPPPPFSLHHTSRGRERPSRTTRDDFRQRLDASIQKTYVALKRTQARYKRDLDKRVRHTNRRLRPGNVVYLDASDGASKLGKLDSPAVGPYRVLFPEACNVIIDRDGYVERVSSDRVVFAPRPTDDVVDDPRKATHTDIREKVRKGPRYTVERIESRRTADGKLEFLVHWVGYEEPTWEPRWFLPE